MTDALAAEAEVRKLAHLLDTSSAQLAELEAYSPAVLRELRTALSAILFNENRKTFRRLAASTRLVPTPLVAAITTKVMGPMIAGRVSGEMPPKKGIAIAQRLPVDFLADVCLHIDPREAPDLVSGLPVPLICQIAERLLHRGDHMTMARFVDVLSDAAISAVIDDTDSDADLLRVGFYVEEPEHLDALISIVGQERLEGLILAANENLLWAEALAILRHVGEDNRQRLLQAALAMPEAVIEKLLAFADAAGDQELLAELAPLREAVAP